MPLAPIDCDAIIDPLSQDDRRVLLQRLIDRATVGPIPLGDADGSAILPLACYEAVPPGQNAVATAPCYSIFRPRRIVILEPLDADGHPIPRNAWTVDGCFFGANSQFAAMGPINGDAFAPDGTLDFDGTIIQPGLTVSLTLRHSLKVSVPFRAVLVGRMLPPRAAANASDPGVGFYDDATFASETPTDAPDAPEPPPKVRQLDIED